MAYETNSNSPTRKTPISTVERSSVAEKTNGWPALNHSQIVVVKVRLRLSTSIDNNTSFSFFYLSVCLSIYLFIHLFIHHSVCLPAHDCLSSYLTIYLSVCPISGCCPFVCLNYSLSLLLLQCVCSFIFFLCNSLLSQCVCWYFCVYEVLDIYTEQLYLLVCLFSVCLPLFLSAYRSLC